MSPSTDLLLRVRKAFMDYGVQELSMVGLSRACGFTRRTLYNYFPNKEEAFRAMFAHLNTEVMAKAREAGDRIDAEGGSVLDIIAGIIDIRYGDLWRILAVSSHASEIKGMSFQLCTPQMVEMAIVFQAEMETRVVQLVADGRLRLKGSFTAAQLVQMLTDSARGVNQVYPLAPLENLYGQYRETCKAILYGYAED